MLSNLRDSGVADIVIANRPGASAAKAEAAGFRVLANRDVARWAFIMFTAADETQPEIMHSISRRT